ncbi:MAG: ATP-dependent helicase [Rhodothermaceae bacterium]|nr:ATP-dependent helicase [Rhodothermaceae bacterium]
MSNQHLLEDQKAAATHIGSHARLLAGPGTGKTFTLTHRICNLVQENNVPLEHIYAITFTRAAAQELRQRVENMLGGNSCPHISTLHSFALKQLLHNRSIIQSLPTPLRIADDWEQRHIVFEDMKALLGLRRINDVQELFHRLSADWQSLDADAEGWEDSFPVPRFLGAWREHRLIYGYAMRSELVYQLKKALEQHRNFILAGCIRHLLVDEYQDLNHCDLEVIKSIVPRDDIELFVVGDDDQSIYGFRKAHPDGIRKFSCDYPDAAELALKTCMRCDRDILNLALFIAEQDHRRIEKTIQAKSDSGRGEVTILRFGDQTREAQGIADICSYLVTKRGLDPSDILILLRSDRYGKYSDPIKDKLEQNQIEATTIRRSSDWLDTRYGRTFLSFLRLCVSREDSLAWRSLFVYWCAGVGPKAINSIYEIAREHGQTFAKIIIAASDDRGILHPRFQTHLSNAIGQVLSQLDELFPNDDSGNYDTHDQLMQKVGSVAESVISDEQERRQILHSIDQATGVSDTISITEFVRAIEVGPEEYEQQVEEERVNILTMHQAKGLTAKAVIVAAAEDQLIPGGNQGSSLDDERRLLYVSLTRAKHNLFVTYCVRRTGPQSHTGSNIGIPTRNLTQFLQDSPYIPKNGEEFISRLKNPGS